MSKLRRCRSRCGKGGLDVLFGEEVINHQSQLAEPFQTIIDGMNLDPQLKIDGTAAKTKKNKIRRRITQHVRILPGGPGENVKNAFQRSAVFDADWKTQPDDLSGISSIDTFFRVIRSAFGIQNEQYDNQ